MGRLNPEPVDWLVAFVIFGIVALSGGWMWVISGGF